MQKDYTAVKDTVLKDAIVNSKRLEFIQNEQHEDNLFSTLQSRR
ncbi:hypothetical protein XCR1_2650008 [Xenorhabdus cabanillasii JM26]|uniref:Uncharacterized protein n=2 Tax=Xenorhabdus cabanillasii TaxID=351673 RepID=A0A3D9UB03_9GAMM|nr:hypothetical protein Xcab_02448 [Xenorhabdus cabanillasii JM26]REF26668.1 hypothetical protein BDD26_1340 [Xenorhabdus cabanillasii]CDL85929.1 hypothetical protein XCR1_2650008 [Xenorhabdus cabanillasii JM26]